jgi:hypothetical protein
MKVRSPFGFLPAGGILLLCVCLALPAARPVADGVDASPTISGQALSMTAIHVTGSHFTPGGNVVVEAQNAVTGSIVALITTGAGAGNLPRRARRSSPVRVHPRSDSAIHRLVGLHLAPTVQHE